MPWKFARKTIYWRLRRLILQHRVLKTLTEAQPNLTIGQGEAMLRRWFLEDLGTTEVKKLLKPSGKKIKLKMFFQGYKWDNNEEVTKWMEYQTEDGNSLLSRNLNAIKKDSIITEIKTHLEVSNILIMI